MVQQQWLQKRLDTFLPALLRKHQVDMWVVPMREYNEDPVFESIVSPTTFAARRRTIYVFFDKCAHGASAGTSGCVERIALGGSSQGGLYDAVRSTRSVDAAVGGRQAELWGDQQWLVLRDVIEQRTKILDAKLREVEAAEVLRRIRTLRVHQEYGKAIELALAFVQERPSSLLLQEVLKEQRLLEGLQAKPAILEAAIRTPDGAMFARYARATAPAISCFSRWRDG